MSQGIGSVMLKMAKSTPAGTDRTSTVSGFEENTAHAAPVRRPLRGIVLRENTYGQMAVVGAGGDSAGLYSSSAQGGRTGWTADLLIQSLSISRSEKFQPLPTFGAAYGYFFGENHTFINVSAALLDTQDFPWKRDWWANYEESLRGTRLVEARRRVVLACNDTLFEGYIVQSNTSEVAAEEGMAQMSFQMWVVNVVYNGTPGVALLPGASGGTERPYVTLPPHRSSSAPTTDPDAPVGLFAALQRISDAFTEVKTWVGDKLEAVEDFLYGRNMVIPAGAMSASAVLTPAQYAAVRDSVYDTSAPTRWQAATAAWAQAATGEGWQNYDEFLENPPSAAWTSGDLTEMDEEIAAFVGEGLSERLNAYSDYLLTQQMQELNPRWTITGGYRPSELVRVLGRASFAAISLGASFSRADVVLAQVVSGVTPIESESNALTAAEARSRAVELSASTRMRAPGVLWPEQ